jgi:hypothetical protein
VVKVKDCQMDLPARYRVFFTLGNWRCVDERRGFQELDGMYQVSLDTL